MCIVCPETACRRCRTWRHSPTIPRADTFRHLHTESLVGVGAPLRSAPRHSSYTGMPVRTARTVRHSLGSRLCARMVPRSTPATSRPRICPASRRSHFSICTIDWRLTGGRRAGPRSDPGDNAINGSKAEMASHRARLFLCVCVSVMCVRKLLAVGGCFFYKPSMADPGANADRRPSVRGRNSDEPRSNGAGGCTRNVVERRLNAWQCRLIHPNTKHDGRLMSTKRRLIAD